MQKGKKSETNFMPFDRSSCLRLNYIFIRIQEEKKYIKYEIHKREEKGKCTKNTGTYEGRCGDD